MGRRILLRTLVPEAQWCVSFQPVKQEESLTERRDVSDSVRDELLCVSRFVVSAERMCSLTGGSRYGSDNVTSVA